MIEISDKKNIILQGIIWHYIDVPANIMRGWRNFLLFNLEYFSIFLLLKTFFSHWRRYRWPYGRGFDPKVYLESFFSNLVSRLLGAVMRSVLIFIGLLSEVFLFFAGLLILSIWLLLPILSLILLYYGIRILL